MNSRHLVALGISAVMLTSSAVQGAIISLNFEGGTAAFGGQPAPMTSDQVAGALPVANWNNRNFGNQDGYSLNKTELDLIDSMGNVTGVDVTTTDVNDAWVTEAGTANGDRTMMQGAIKRKDFAAFNISLSSLTVGQAYDLYIYTASGDGEDKFTNFSLTAGSAAISSYFIEAQTGATFANSQTYIRGVNTLNTVPAMNGAVANYVRFENVLPDEFGMISFSTAANANQTGDIRSAVTGLQLQAVPEPNTLLFALIGSAGMAMSRRRR
jgi:hypothetical protein